MPVFDNLIARYCPTIDDSPSDLVGSFDGTYIGSMGTVVDTGHGGERVYLFDGSNDRIQIPGLYTSDGSDDFPFTVAMWIKAASPSSSQTWFGNYNGSGSGFSIGTYASLLYAGMRSTDGGYASIRVSVPYAFTTWKHVAVSYDGSTDASGIKVYIDGVRQTETDASEMSYVKMSAIAANINIGSRAYDQRFAGRLDDIMAFDLDKSASDLADIYSAGPGYIDPAPDPPPSVPTSTPRSLFNLGRLFAA
ncbi:LamG domain-containing protein [Allorhodopirellula heiligendammensis]|uniref:LamG-like jellyroll fold domain-containing protein n=1 Tax=Allorhodopirellula heiligendammensis TaxID=2714739 RepID=A0A5C6BXE4_9BACT|nr:LamG domain-containing protein [Allorhodopirellula heiligendammensis]TWU15956.1 hypothetical protein Poly21_31600 [Allorhodopirellula heiligendammensis]